MNTFVAAKATYTVVGGMKKCISGDGSFSKGVQNHRQEIGSPNFVLTAEEMARHQPIIFCQEELQSPSIPRTEQEGQGT